MEIHQQIENEINAVKEWNQVAGNKLHKQLHTAQGAKWARDDLSNLLKSEEDVADEHYNETDSQHSEIRNIQDSIIGFYAVSEK